MRSPHFITTLASLATLSYANPTPQFTPDIAPQAAAQAFTVNQVSAGYKLKHGGTEVVRTFAKFGKTPPGTAVEAANRNTAPLWLASPPVAARDPQVSGTVTATPQQYDAEYLEPVKIGSQTFNLDFDTGSSDLWVLGSGLKTTGSHTIYAPGSTAKLLSGESWKISYGDGSSASGNVYADTVSIGAATFVGQAVENAQTASSAFTSGVDDGLVGLAFDSINTVTPSPVKTITTNLISKGMTPVFTAKLKKGAPGTYDFGFIDTKKNATAITYANVDNSQGFWMFTPQSYAVGTGATVTPGASAMTGIVDTGTTLLYVSTSIVKAYYAKVSGAKNSANAGGWIFPCSATLPAFTLVVGGYKAVVPGTYLSFAPNGDGTCFGGLQDGSGIGFNIYGDIFIKSQFIVFDKGMTSAGPRVGFAAQS